MGVPSSAYLGDADAVGLVVEARRVVVHVSHLDVDRPLDHLRRGAGISFVHGFQSRSKPRGCLPWLQLQVCCPPGGAAPSPP